MCLTLSAFGVVAPSGALAIAPPDPGLGVSLQTMWCWGCWADLASLLLSSWIIDTCVT